MRLAISALGMHSKSGYLKAGVSRYAFNLINALTKTDLDEIHVFAPMGFVMPAPWTGKVEVHPVDLSKWRKKALWEMFGSVVWCRRLQPDVWLSTAHGIPVIGVTKRAVMVHDLFPLRYPHLFRGSYAKQVSKALIFSIRNSDVLLANSNATRDDVVATFGVRPGRVHVTPLGPGNTAPRVEKGEVSRADLERLSIPYERFLFTMSSIGPRKNVPRLIEAFARIAKESDQGDLGLVIGGAAEWKASEVNEAVIKAGIANRVVFPGYISDEDVPLLFAKAEAFVFPSLHEGFGLPVLESMIYGAPCCATGRGALREVGGEAAVYFDPDDPNDIAQTVLGVLRNPELQGQMRSRGFAQAAGFTWERTASATLAALGSVG